MKRVELNVVLATHQNSVAVIAVAAPLGHTGLARRNFGQTERMLQA
jgi:hypothetical protein